MGSVRAKRKGPRAKRVRSPRVSKGKPQSHSALRDEIWAVVGLDEKWIHFGCTYDEALGLATKRRGTVMTDAAANRIHGFNDIASALG